ncbi:MAG: addiction module toxin RelE [Prevotellaceae bacterium]|jgi:mRNA-degrading endonuclease RelE of RelBE toxin-antitoxin system|nr:addiction module toxin RelE [Prevotellaceae bacterium]
MSATIRVTRSFKRQAKSLLKKYPSLQSELKQLNGILEENPHFGTEITHGVYKIRLAIKSKGKGKSGGARVISYHSDEPLVIGITDETNENVLAVNLIAIYDKSETENIDDSEIRYLISNMAFD